MRKEIDFLSIYEEMPENPLTNIAYRCKMHIDAFTI